MIQRKSERMSSLANPQLLPKEQLLIPQKKSMKLSIGIPNVVPDVEFRIPLTPQAVELLVSNGHDVFIEKGAGEGSSYSDHAYAESGAVICETKAEIFQSDVIVKMSAFTHEEAKLLKGNQLLLSPLYITFQSQETVRKMMQKRVTAIGFEYMKDEHGIFPVTRILSEIMGNAAIFVASEYLSTHRNGKGVILGGITGISPTEVVIIGSGTAAEFAARNALGLGAVVKVFDDSIHKLMRFQERLGQRVFTSVFHPKALKKALKSADVAIGALSMNEVPKIVVPETMVENMKNGSVIIDLNIIQGGCFETSRITNLKKPVFNKHGVIHYCVPNISSRMARTTSISVSNIIAPILLNMGRSGSMKQYIRVNQGFCEGIYVFNGILTNHDLGNILDIPVKDINLLLAAF
jgi:alanine dehydrogenase